jgi:hypothetical protein
MLISGNRTISIRKLTFANDLSSGKVYLRQIRIPHIELFEVCAGTLSVALQNKRAKELASSFDAEALYCAANGMEESGEPSCCRELMFDAQQARQIKRAGGIHKPIRNVRRI